MSTRLSRRLKKNNLLRLMNKRCEMKKLVSKFLIKVNKRLMFLSFYLFNCFLHFDFKFYKREHFYFILYSIYFFRKMYNFNIAIDDNDVTDNNFFLDKDKNIKILQNYYDSNIYHYKKFSKNSSISFLKNICLKTGRYRGILSFYKLSRMKLKELATMGIIPGVRRSSW